MCSVLEALRDAELEVIDAAYAGKALLLQQDRAAVEARMDEWGRMAARLPSAGGGGAAAAADVDGNAVAAVGQGEAAHACVEGEHAYTAAMAALALTWRLRCGHAGAPWPSSL
jgi:hypothetical protein